MDDKPPGVREDQGRVAQLRGLLYGCYSLNTGAIQTVEKQATYGGKVRFT